MMGTKVRENETESTVLLAAGAVESSVGVGKGRKSTPELPEGSTPWPKPRIEPIKAHFRLLPFTSNREYSCVNSLVPVGKQSQCFRRSVQ